MIEAEFETDLRDFLDYRDSQVLVEEGNYRRGDKITLKKPKLKAKITYVINGNWVTWVPPGKTILGIKRIR